VKPLHYAESGLAVFIVARLHCPAQLTLEAGSKTHVQNYRVKNGRIRQGQKRMSLGKDCC
jgi:hypothetical protein